MKIRTGFVSNSSTSSFLMYGLNMDEDVFLEKVRKQIPNRPMTDPYDYFDSEEGSKFLKDNNLEWEAPCDYYAVYIGKSWHSIKDDQTGAEFKAEIEEALKSVFGDDLEIGTQEAAWGDG